MTDSSLTGRLRDILRGSRGPRADGIPSPVAHPPAAHDGCGETVATAREVGQALARNAAAVLGGAVVDTDTGPCVRITRAYEAHERLGLLRVSELLDGLNAGAAGLPLLGGAMASPCQPRALLFVDIETTGLAGGAGTHAFLVGCASLERDVLRVDQFFMIGHALERALLGLVRQAVEAAGALVTYNGKTFDVPVLETRYLYHRQPPPFPGRGHIDMLHIARRLWRGARGIVAAPGVQSDSCALTSLEQALFGMRRHADVPGFEIPARFFAFLRSADARPLAPVVEHNRLDLVSLAAITARALRLVNESPSEVQEARECFGAGRLFEQAGDEERAEPWFLRAAELATRSWQHEDALIRAHAFRALAIRRRRQGRYDDAARYWECLLSVRPCPPALLREGLEALAVHCEHRARDLERARSYAERSRGLARAAAQGAAVEHRLARLQRKMRDRGPMLAT
jgi:uncharacterized protein YprB with RNaseH-like and TPR domain